MSKAKTGMMRKAALACALAAVALMTTAVAYAAGGGLSAQDAGYTVNFEVGPYAVPADETEAQSMEFEEGLYLFSSPIVPDGTKMGAAGGAMASQTGADYGTALNGVSSSSFSVVGYQFAYWAQKFATDEGDMVVGPILGDGDTLPYSADEIAELGGELDLVAIWQPYSEYHVRFYSRDAASGGASLLEQHNLSWNGNVTAPTDAQIADVGTLDDGSNIKGLSAEERAKITWYTKPGGPSGGGLLWSGGAFYTTVTEGSMTDAQAIAAEAAVRAAGGVVTLYPYYQPATVAVEYYGNGSDGDTGNALSSPSQSINAPGSAAALAPVNLTRNNGTSEFIGWSTSSSTLWSDTANIIKVGDDITVTASTASPLKLYAVWKDKYTVAYDTGGGTPAAIADVTVNSAAADNLLPSATMDKVGYSATDTLGGVVPGWYVKDASTGAATATMATSTSTFADLYAVSHDANGAVTLVYVYAPKSYTVNYDWNGATVSGIADPYVKSDQKWDDPVSEPGADVLANVSKPGYELDYWTLSDETTQLSSATTYGAYSIANGNTTGDTGTALTVKAHWKALGAVVNYIPLEPDGASGSIAGTIAPAKKDKDGADLLSGGTVVLPNSGMTLTGWTLSSWSFGTVDAATGAVTLTTSAGSAGAEWAVTADVNNLYSVWTANTYTVAVTDGTASPTSATYDSTEITLTHTGTAPQGFTFAGWATKSGVTDVSDAAYVAPSSGTVAGGDAKYKNLTAANGATVDLYPVYVPDDVTVTLSLTDPANPSAAATTTTVTHKAASTGHSLSAPADVQGYIFKGWYDGSTLYGTRAGTSKTDASQAYDGEIATWPTADVTLTSAWTEMDGFAITFINNHGHKDASGNPSQTPDVRQNLKWTDSVALPAGPAVNAKATDGYTFAGWYKLSDLDADGAPAAGATPAMTAAGTYGDIVGAMGLSDITATTPTSPTLYAGWVAEPAEVELQNGAFTAANSATRTPAVAAATGSIAAGATTYAVSTKVGATPALPNHFSLAGYEFKCWKLGSGADAKYYDASGAAVDSDGNAIAGGAAYKANATGNAANTLVAQWKPIEYTVKFEDGSGNASASGTELKVSYDDYASATLPDGATLFSKTGYTFLNWKDASANTTYGAAALAGNLRDTAGTVVLVAQWSASVTYTFTQGEGTLVAGTKLPGDVVVASGGTWEMKDVPDVPAGLVRDGYTADGWTDGKNDYKRAASGTYNVPSVSAPTTVVLYPKWTAKSASVVLHYKDGTTPDATISADKDGAALVTGATMSLPAAPTRAGYTFMGWSVADDDDIDTLVGDVPASATTCKAPAGKPSNLYAVWLAGGVTISFDANAADATGTMADQTNLKVGASTGTLNANAFTRDGYTFEGWATSTSGTVEYADKQEFSATVKVPAPASAASSTVTLYAVWSAKDYTITFKPNGADGSPADGTQTVAADQSPAALAGPTYTRTGYDFDGWSASSGRTAYVAGTDWKQGASYALDVSGAAGANTLYAIWKPKGDTKYTIERYQEALDGSWVKAADSTSAPLVGEQSGTTGDAVSIAGDVAVYDGFTLDGTVANATVGGETLSTNLSGTVAADGTTVLRAFYTRNKHSVTYKLDPAGQATPSGFTMPAGAASVKYGAAYHPAAAPTATGWTFTGWTTTDATVADGKFTMPDKDVVFTGTWEQSTFTVTFDGNGGTVANEPSPDMQVPSGQKMSADQKAAAQAVTFTKDGSYAASWEKKVGDAEWTACAAEPWDETITAATVFRPVWAATYAVVYKPGVGGDWNEADETYAGLAADAAYASFSFPKAAGDAVSGTPKGKAGYTFAGWKLGEATYATTADFQSFVTSDHESTIWGNLTLEAQWTRTAHKLNIDFDGGAVDEDATLVAADGAAAAVTVAKGATTFAEATVGAGLAVALPSVSKAGAVFNGWTVTAGGVAPTPVGAKAVFDMPDADVTLTASWVEGAATIAYRSGDTDKGTVSVTKQVVNPATGDVNSQEPTPGQGETAVLGSTAEPTWGYELSAWKRVSDGAVVGNAAAFAPQAPAGGFTDETYEAVFAKRSFSVRVNAEDLSANNKVEILYDDDSWKQTPYLDTLEPGKIVASVKSAEVYKFGGWRYKMDTNGDGTYDKVNDLNSLLADPAEVAIEGDTVFEPVFVPSKVGVVYNVNDPASTSVDANTTHTDKAEVDAAYTLQRAADLFTLPAGYTFAGWATTPTGAVEYAADAVEAGTAQVAKMPAGGMTLYAKWNAEKASIVYEPGRRAASGAVSETDATHDAGEVNVPVKALADTAIAPASGYAFAGWLGSDGVTYCDPDAASPKTTIDRLPGEGLTLTAQWTLAVSDIIYNGNGGKTGNNKDEIRIPSAALFDIIVWTKGTVEEGDEGQPVFARQGYTFRTWNAKADGTGIEYAPGSRSTMPASGGLTLYAQWSANGAALTLDAGEGTFEGGASVRTLSGVTDQQVSLGDIPVRDGFTFKGWSKTQGAKKADAGLEADVASLTLGFVAGEDAYEADTVLYAAWAEDGVVDKDDLSAAIAAAKAAEAGVAVSADGKDVEPSAKWTTAAEKKALDDAIAVAQAVADDPDATQDDVDAAKAAVDAAKATYEAAKKDGAKAQPAAVDKTALKKSIDAAKATESGVATSTDGKDVEPSDKWTTAAERKALDDAIAVAQKVYDNQGATQTQVDAAKKSLDEAKAAYDAAKKDGKKASGGNGNGDNGYGDNGNENGNGEGDNGNGNGNEAEEPLSAQIMYRAYNPYSGEHHYTADKSELDAIVAAGWVDEGVGWVAPVESAVPVYRLYNSYEPLGDHHYTTDRDEYDAAVAAGWTGEGIGWYSDEAGRVPLHRVYNPYAYGLGMTGAHHYTANKEEADGLAEGGWVAEGTAWYGVAADAGSLPEGVVLADSLAAQSAALVATAF